MSEYVIVPKDVFERAGQWMSAALDCSTTCDQCKDDFAAILKDAKASGGAGGWRDIESAPKDGSSILVCWDTGCGTDHAVVWWSYSTSKQYPWAATGACYPSDKFDQWMHLPSPSSAGGRVDD